ncbi:glycosyltransferase [Aureimonas sp. SK2]|uniref:glycosyltransferase n=1 Tax=Aureimonas sp. SK2 TaxID=3015992 RepID=UPI002444E44A|nr:glycosyltransferase [Aureimonas sp. SK2]
MSETPSKPSSIGSLVASRRRRLAGAAPEAGLRPPEDSAMRLAARRSGETLIEGWAADPADPERRFVVELLLDGVPAALARAELRLGPLGPGEAMPVGDGCHGFAFALDPAVLPFARTASVRLANGGEAVGEPIALHEAQAFAPSPAPTAEARWLGGLDLAGWVHRPAGEGAPPRIEARIDDAVVALARADGWREVVRAGAVRAEPAFRLRLPPRFADGRLHEVELFADGQPLPGGAIPVLAFADGLAAHLEAEAETDGEILRAERFDRWFPRGVPFSDVARWEARFPAQRPAIAAAVAVAVAGEDGAEASLSAPALDALGDWIGVVLPERDGGFEPTDLRSFLEGEAEACPIVLLMPAGTVARPGGAERLVAALEGEPAAAIAYGDRILALDGGGTAPLLATAFDTERALEQGCAVAPFAMRREALLAALREGAGDLDRIFLHPLDRGFSGSPLHLHVPGFGFAVPPASASAADRLEAAVVAHLAARGVMATVEHRPPATLPAVRVRREIRLGACAILLDAGWRDEAEIAGALEALEATRRRRGTSVLVSSPRLDERAAARLRLGGVEVRLAPGARSPARRLNEAADHTNAEVLCILDAGLAPLDDRWLDELLGRLSDPGTGLVAPVIVGRNGDVREAGLVLEWGRAPRARYAGRGAEDPGHGDGLLVAHQVSGVGPGALVTRRADLLALGGFDPVLFPRHFGAADYALKLQALGRRVVVAPDARLLREAPDEPASPILGPGLAREAEALASRWPGVTAADPFGNPLLQRGGDGFEGLAWPPGACEPRTAFVAPPRPVAPGW